MTGNLVIIAAAAVLSCACVFVLIRRAAQLGLVQAPEARSSHVRPTPTGGGIGIVAGALVAGLSLPGADGVSLLILALGLVIALVGLIDDRRPLPARVRLPVQALVVAALLWSTGAAGALAGGLPPVFHLGAAVLLLIGGLWWINLFNFMDGIDGIAGQQAILMLLSAMLIAFGTVPGVSGGWTWWMMAATAAATIGFLVFNWPPARIFMGDAGSTFLGFVLFASAMLSLVAGWLSLPQWLVLAALFAGDATVTLLVRLLRGENVAQAHRSHAYQRLSRRFNGARPVSSGFAVVNLLVLLPIAFILPQEVWAWLVVVVVYVCVIGAALACGAGLPDQQPASFNTYRRLLSRSRN
ncbi:MraY family glycosyltransferase [Rhizobium sp. SAFR-030]|uniref:MraY family glycosyltransferase n=1 Tax=Rhizobium sp. SAFR-030 TaxID=3387277 RepID=UPI003F7F40E1